MKTRKNEGDARKILYIHVRLQHQTLVEIVLLSIFMMKPYAKQEFHPRIFANLRQLFAQISVNSRRLAEKLAILCKCCCSRRDLAL